MPTGFTAKLVDQDQPFENFVWTCARAMGCFIHMRDDPLDATIYVPDLPFGAEFNLEQLKRLREELEAVKEMSPEKIRNRVISEYLRQVEYHNSYSAKSQVVKQRLESMIAKVEAWNASPAHQNFKKFMLDQLRETVEHDCRPLTPPEGIDWEQFEPEEWRAKQIAWIEDSLAWYTKRNAESIKAHHENIQWVKDLAAEIKPPYQIVGV